MPQPIKKSDIIEGKILDGLISEFERAKVVNDEFNKSLKESAALLKSKLSNTKVDNTASLNAQKEAIAESNRLLKEKIALDKASQQNAITEEKLKQQKLRTQKMENAEVEKEIKAKTRLDSIYMRFNDKLKRTRDEYRELAIRKEAFNNLSTKEEIKLATLEKRVGYYDKALKKVDATMGMHQRNVGNYAMSNGTLSNSVNQLTREMPAFANSVGTGFMAISNNLPIFFDEIKKLKQANVELQASGQPTQSILKQVGASIFSVGTALSVGVTLLTVYGAKLVEWISNLDGSNDKLQEQLKLQKQQEEATEKMSQKVAEESAEYVGLIYALKQTNENSKERTDLINKINEQYGTTLSNMDNEIEFQLQLNESLADYIKFQRLRYLEELNREKNKKLLQEELKLTKELEVENAKNYQRALKQTFLTAEDKKRLTEHFDLEKQLLSVNANGLTIQDAKLLRIKEIRGEMEATAIQEMNLNATINKSNFSRKTTSTKTTKPAKQQLQELNDYLREITDERIAQIQDEYTQKQLLMITNAKRRAEDIAKEVGDEKQKAVLIKEIEKSLLIEIKKLKDEYDEAERKRIHDIVKEAEDSEAEQLRVAYENAIKEVEDKNKIRETNLYNSDANDKQIANITRQNQIDMLEEKIELAKKYGQKTTDLELELAKLRVKKVTDVTKNEFINLMKPIIDAEIKMSQKRVELLDKEMAKRQEAYNLYTELAKNGTIQAQQSLALEQQAIVEANKKKAEEMKRQERLKFAESTFSAYASNVDKGEKNPLLKTITDMTLLRQFISSMPSFLVGTEDTGANGNGVDGKGGFHAILHPNERVMTKEQNAMLGGLKNDEVAETIANVRSGKIVSLKHDKAGNSFDLKPLLSEIQELKQVIRQKPETNIELGEIVQGAMEIVQTTKQGNTVKRNRYIV